MAGADVMGGVDLMEAAKLAMEVVALVVSVFTAIHRAMQRIVDSINGVERQVRITNGRLTKLEQWATDHDKEDVRREQRTSTELTYIKDRLTN